MKTIITSTGDNVDSKFDLRFGRAGWFCVYDKETHSTNFIENSFKNSNGGAGTKSSEMAAELGAKQIISGHFGPKAKDMLAKFQIQMIEFDNEKLNVKDIILKIENN
ncbi:NifB/NifX family molybdenum-iron cluster-binding protein [Draconibacterium halophilum]|uniref:Dinitrogenase iron-molybdenum cofactor biosynthesis protein n=1 Tax=Draconibacterium halophilum TaxID=2706887 RepID=A0A6C0REL7_9BACT|nr:NifB/NifX family molybdenum-iron cluster-binding protein [Draconibacterium halophilum]QIA08386.1 dinitrogenase iron-molybdenum cofactor biosynthesis protein [Draconibacterium halophilum]